MFVQVKLHVYVLIMTLHCTVISLKCFESGLHITSTLKLYIARCHRLTNQPLLSY